MSDGAVSATKTDTGDGRGGLAVVAGDAISRPRRSGPAPWHSPARERDRTTRRGGGVPLGFVPLAAVAVAFLTL
ncbi:MAG: hypothetical protein QM323_01180, partial [Acidobacteriota bacterium]|nr:hypothetical protein [Acidobacteriota bacterium]